MRVTRAERIRAERVSEEVDRLVCDPEAQMEFPDLDDAGLLRTARQFARLPALLGQVDAALEQRVIRLSQDRVGAQRSSRLSRMRPHWGIAGVVAVLVLVVLLSPFGQTAVASFMAVFNLGRTEVRITPVDVPSALRATDEIRGAVVRQNLTLDEAAEQAFFPILQPSHVPPGFDLLETIGHTYPDLPAWVPQPFSIELVYKDGQGRRFTLRMYPITLGTDTQARVSGMNLEASPIQEVQDVDVDGHPGVLLRLGSLGDKAGLQELVWEQGDLVLALSTSDLSEAELLLIARSVRQ